MSLTQPVGSDHQLARLLQIGIVLEEVVEARAAKHAEETDASLDPALRDLLDHAASESADHRSRLEQLVDDLEAETVPFEEIQMLVEAQYEADEDFDGVLYDQLCNEETAYKFYDDLIASIEASDTAFSVDRERLLDVLRTIREEEADGVEEVTDLMEERQ
ncbi:ferritin-like domain-containing protein [Halomicroarcula sp. S1AR25-4]|uniref:ferritin-like domain-containing protein n=1 Tax=Haloarcula sp. S1AR25-4 TaxID=2950538 RepID=UPI002875640E|nr:ferritin-like domain-containing protein [Halomicroarcula sp. S1AR25-4]MDS0277375.1 ferritin-like domain-containing protein [Halomicroarcula sp. S1AR25-4]